MAVDARRIRFRKEPVKKAMKEKGVNQMDLAELIDRGERSIKSAFIEELILPEHLLKITDYLGLSYHEIALTDDVFVPVIRCKDCRYWDRINHSCLRNGTMPWDAFDFCSNGRRKPDETD